VRFNARFLDLAGCYEFKPRACRPYRARTKGKTERIVRYVKENFFQRHRSSTASISSTAVWNSGLQVQGLWPDACLSLQLDIGLQFFGLTLGVCSGLTADFRIATHPHVYSPCSVFPVNSHGVPPVAN